MTRLDDRERRIASWLAATAVVASVALWAPAFDKAAGVILAAVGVVLAGLLALAARSRRRLVTCLAALVLGFGPWGMAWLLGLPYILLATWLLFRDRKAAAERGDRHRRRLGAKPDGHDPDTPARPARERPARPEPSKRYTPPQRRS